jgi:hypothetical protein
MATHLVTLDLDQLLQSVHHIKVTVLVVVSQVASVKPALTLNDLSGLYWSIQVTLHDLRQSCSAELTAGLELDRKAWNGVPVIHNITSPPVNTAALH